MDSYITKSLTGLLLIINFVHGVSNAETFSPAQEPLIRDLRPKPNIMLVMDTSKAGVDSKISLSSKEKEYFKDELEKMGLSGGEITKTQAISVALLKILKTYQHIAHFGLAKIGESSPYGYITEGAGYYTTSEVEDVDPIIHPIYTNYGGDDKKYAGNYNKRHSKEKTHIENLRKSIAEFQQDYSSTASSTRAWNYGLSEINKYFWGSRYYKDDSNRNFEASKEKHVANKILPEDISKGITGEARIEYKTYEDPIRFICQQSHILYFPVEKSGAYDSVKNYDRIINIPVTSWEETTGGPKRAGQSQITTDKDDVEFNKLYLLSNKTQNEMIARLLSAYMRIGNAGKGKSGKYGWKHSELNSVGNDLADLNKNLWKNWDSEGTYNPADLYISAIYAGKGFSIPYLQDYDYTSIWNEKRWWSENQDYFDYLQGFIYEYSRGSQGNSYKMYNAPTPGLGVNSTIYKSRATDVYLRANQTNNEPTLSNIYERSKEYLGKIILSYKSNGRYILDQHLPESQSYTLTQEHIGYSINHTEQFWTTEIRAYDPRKPLKSGGYPNSGSATTKRFFADVDSESTWTTSEKITYDQGKIFTASNGVKQELSTVASGDEEKWLRGDLSLDPADFRVRNVILGDVVNSSIVYEARDHFHINVDLVGDRDRYIDYMYKKRDHFENNLLIAGSNDGFLNFIVAGRNSENSAGEDLAGTRKAAYFIPFFKKDIKDIVEPLSWYGGSFEHKYRVDGQINIFDAIVDDGFKTTGIAGMGAGYKGLVGFELFSIDEGGNVDNKGEVKPLFEIDNKTYGFNNLGYTYSGFSFFNDSTEGGQSIAVFGNGPGNKNDISSLFFINAITGELVAELELSAGKGGAFTPALVLAKDGMGQKIEKIYVGDYSGKLFRIDFNNTSSELSERITNAKVTTLFDAANGVEGRPISVKPYIVRNTKTSNDWIYFGTGMLATKEQKNNNAVQNFFAIEDKRQDSIAISSLNMLKINQIDTTQLIEESQSLPPSFNGLQSALMNDEMKIEVKNSRDLTENENGWYIPLALPPIRSGRNIIPVSFNGSYEKNPSINVIYPAAMLMGNRIVFSARQVFDSKTDNVCASDVVQSPFFVLDAFTGAPQFKAGVENNSLSNFIGGNIVDSLGVIAPYRSFSVLTQDSYVGNIESGYNISLKEEERKRLDDVLSIGYNSLDIRKSKSSNIGGRRKGRYSPDVNILDYKKYKFAYDMINGQRAPEYQSIYFGYFPYSGIFGEEGTSEGHTVGSFDPEPKKKLTPRRISIRKIF